MARAASIKAGGPRERRVLAAGLDDSGATWLVPARGRSVGWTLDEAFAEGGTRIPWRRNFEFDGMWEEWESWVGLSLQERLSTLAWSGPTLAGTGDQGALAGHALSAGAAVAEFGGQRAFRLYPGPVATDTPRTNLEFHRGALASYSFGMDFARAIQGPWALSMGMETRSAQSKAWVYRDQIQDMFQGSFGRGREDLPAFGRSAGQDDVQWNALLSRAVPGSRLDFGWNWVDLERGQPDPTKIWGSDDKPVYPAYQTRSGWFGRWLQDGEAIRSEWLVRSVSEDWAWSYWPVNAVPALAHGSIDHQTYDGVVRWGRGAFVPGLELQAAVATGRNARDSSLSGVSKSISDVNEDQERAGGFVETDLGGLHVRTGAGWTRLNASDASDHGAWDASARMDVRDSFVEVHGGWVRSNRLPDEASMRPKPLFGPVMAPGQATENQDLFDVQGAIRPWKRLLLDAGGSVMVRQNAWETREAPAWDLLARRSKAMTLVNMGTVLGWSGYAGIGANLGGWHGRSQWGIGWTGLPGEGFDGVADVRIPRAQTRWNLGWKGKLLADRVGASFDANLGTYTSTMAWVGIGDSSAIAVELPSSSQLDLEFQVSIKTFAIEWKLENILDARQIPAPGWTPPGIRAGWGITWNFGG